MSTFSIVVLWVGFVSALLIVGVDRALVRERPPTPAELLRAELSEFQSWLSGELNNVSAKLGRRMKHRTNKVITHVDKAIRKSTRSTTRWTIGTSLMSVILGVWAGTWIEHHYHPYQVSFTGVVNGEWPSATILVRCASAGSDQFGHPVPGQVISVRKVPVQEGTGFADTGTSRFHATMTNSSAPDIPLGVFGYGTSTISGALNLPCGGQTTLVVRPYAGSPQESSSEVTVNLVHVG
jgi:hypothetical protein